MDLATLAETVGLLQHQLEKFQEEYCSSGSSGGSPTQTLNPFVGAPPEVHHDDPKSPIHNVLTNQMAGNNAIKLSANAESTNHYSPGECLRLNAILP